MQDAGKKPETEEPLEALRSLRGRLREELANASGDDIATPDAPAADTLAEAPDTGPPPVAPAARPNIDPAKVSAALNQLQDQDLQQVLATVPVHQLARALEQLLRPGDSVPVQHGAIDTDPDNQREAERSKTLRTGKIIYNNKMSVTDCKVLDLSNSGCRVALESLTGIPDHFMLHIVHGNAKHECEVTWRKSNMMGLKFIG